MFLLSYYSTGVIAEFCLESVVAAHTAIECPAPQPIRRGLRPETSCGWKTSVCEPSPHIPCSFQPQERRHPPEKERGHGSVELTGERQGCSTVPCRIKIRSLERINKVWVQRTENTQSHTNTHTQPLCSQDWHTASNKASLLLTAGEVLVGVVRSASPRRHVPWQHSYLIGCVAMATEASLLSQG